MAHSIVPAFSSAPAFVYRLTLQLHSLDVLTRTHIFQREQLAVKLMELEQQGIVEATPYFAQGKYLYLISPMRQGKRKRVYIGSDREACAKAEADIERGKEHLSIQQQIHLVDGLLANLAEKLELFIANATKEAS